MIAAGSPPNRTALVPPLRRSPDLDQVAGSQPDGRPRRQPPRRVNERLPRVGIDIEPSEDEDLGAPPPLRVPRRRADDARVIHDEDVAGHQPAGEVAKAGVEHAGPRSSTRRIISALHYNLPGALQSAVQAVAAAHRFVLALSESVLRTESNSTTTGLARMAMLSPIRPVPALNASFGGQPAARRTCRGWRLQLPAVVRDGLLPIPRWRSGTTRSSASRGRWRPTWRRTCWPA